MMDRQVGEIRTTFGEFLFAEIDGGADDFWQMRHQIDDTKDVVSGAYSDNTLRDTCGRDLAHQRFFRP